MFTLNEAVTNNKVYVNYKNLDLPEDTKVWIDELIEPAEPAKREIYLDKGCRFCIKFAPRTCGKAKGEDLFNNVSSIFDAFLKVLYTKGELDSMYHYILESEQKRTLEDSIERFKCIRVYKDPRTQETGIPDYAAVRTIPTDWIMKKGGVGNIDYNVMIFTIAKTRIDMLLERSLEDSSVYTACKVCLQKHFLTESAIISNCVDIPLLGCINEHAAEYQDYLHAAIDATRDMASAAIACCQLVEDITRYNEKR